MSEQCDGNVLLEKEDKINDLRHDRNEWRDIAKRREKEIHKLKHKLQTIQYEADQLKMEKKEWKKGREYCDREKSKWKSKYRRIEKERESHLKQQKHVEYQNKELHQRVNEVKKSNKRLSAKSKSIASTNKVLQATINKLQKEKKEWKFNANKYQNDQLRVAEETNYWKNSYESIAKENKQLKIRMKKLQKDKTFRKNMKYHYSSKFIQHTRELIGDFRAGIVDDDAADACCDKDGTFETKQETEFATKQNNNVYLPRICI